MYSDKKVHGKVMKLHKIDSEWSWTETRKVSKEVPVKKEGGGKIKE